MTYNNAGEPRDLTNETRLSRSARRAERGGRYFPAVDADGLDVDGNWVGAEYPGRPA